MGWPGQLPSRIQLIPADGRPEASLAVQSVAHSIVKPGESFEIQLLGGTAERSLKIDLVAKSLVDDSAKPVGTVEFPASPVPVSKPLKVSGLSNGAYILQATVDGKQLRPNDLKVTALAVSTVGAPAPEVPAKSTKFELAGVYGSGIVVQRNVTLPVWGTAKPGSTVKVDFGGQSQSATTQDDGSWSVKFSPINEKGPFKLTVVCGTEKISHDDILVGDVWLLSGQSNMGGRLREITNGTDTAKSDAKYPEVRLGWAALSPTESSGYRFGVSWQPAAIGPKQTFEQLLGWNGIAFAFGTELHKKLDIPIGMVINNRGGTFISTWVSQEAMRKDPAFRYSIKRWDDLNADDGISQSAANGLPSAIQSAKQKGTAINVDEIIKTKFEGPYRNVPGKNFEGLTRPLGQFPFKGVLWYQGESDSDVAYLYGSMLRAFMAEWRNLIGNQDMPFVVVQIAYGKGQAWKGPPGDSRFGEQQLAQASVLETPNTSVATTYDLPTPTDDVHYKDKLPVGYRAALATLHDVYGMKDVVGYGPRYQSMKVEGNKIHLTFTETAKGMKIKGDKLGGFSIAGADQKFVWADAVLDGNSVVVSSEKVPQPVAVRYGWADSPCGANLYNSADLPAMVFRTDDWPLSTKEKTEKANAE